MRKGGAGLADLVDMKLAAFALPLVLVACGGATSGGPGGGGPTPPVVVNPGSTLTFTPSTVDAARFASQCGVTGVPPYTDADLFSLDAVGAQNPVPRTLINVAMSRHVAVGSPYSIVLDAPSVNTGTNGSNQGQGGSSADGVLRFSMSWGANAAEIDPNALRSVTVTVDAFPPQDGDPLTVHCVMQFTDGKTLDVTFSADTGQSFSGCAAG